MLPSIPPEITRIHLYAEPISMAWGEKKLTAICRDDMGIDPEDGGVFLFHNRSKDQLRLFFLDEDGSQMLTKLLPDHAFVLPVVPDGQRSMEIPRTLLAPLFKF